MTLNRGVGLLVIGLAVAGMVGCGSSSSGSDAGGGTGGSGTGGSGTASGGTTGSGGATGSGGTSGSGGIGGMSTSGVTGTKRIDALTTAEKQQLCDWTAQHFGGYGMSIDCGNGNSLSAAFSQAYCVSSIPTNCSATVSAYETCVNDTSCSDFVPASCGPLLACS